MGMKKRNCHVALLLAGMLAIGGLGHTIWSIENQERTCIGRGNEKTVTKSYGSSAETASSAGDFSTNLSDGSYSPDSFNWSGGSGRIDISCDKIIIENGESYAEIVFSSSHYQYVKVNGQKINCSHSGDTSTAKIPVQLNANNEVVGMTTAMSTAHEITYSLYFGLQAEDSSSSSGSEDSAEKDKAKGGSGKEITATAKKMDSKAPSIPGLCFKSETEIIYSNLIKIFNYSGGYKLVEIDRTKGTADAPDKKNKTKTENSSDTTKKVSSTNEEEAVDDEETSIADQKAEVYEQNIVRYLVVPKGKEIPAGLDKKVVIIQKPTNTIYTASAQGLELMESLDLLGNIRSLGIKAEDVKIDSVKEAMNKNQEDEDGILYGGAYDDLDYKQCISQKINLVILPSDILTHKGDSSSDGKKMSLKEQRALYKKTVKHGIQLDMAILIDRSMDENNELAQAEWLKAYGAIFGAQKEAAKQYQTVVEKASQAQKDAAVKAMQS